VLKTQVSHLRLSSFVKLIKTLIIIVNSDIIVDIISLPKINKINFNDDIFTVQKVEAAKVKLINFLVTETSVSHRFTGGDEAKLVSAGLVIERLLYLGSTLDAVARRCVLRKGI